MRGGGDYRDEGMPTAARDAAGEEEREAENRKETDKVGMERTHVKRE